jgi:hypothetical protein
MWGPGSEWCVRRVACLVQHKEERMQEVGGDPLERCQVTNQNLQVTCPHPPSPAAS